MGCRACGYTGYSGRTLISELFEINREIALALSRGISETELKRMALSGGMKTMIDDGLLKLDQITLTEIIRVVPIEMIKEFASREKNTAECATSPSAMMPDSYSERITIVLSNPEKEEMTIDCLFERYQLMRKSTGQSPAPVEPHIFRRFISQSFKRVTDQFGCSHVRFEFIAQNKKIKITAMPAKEMP
jgi:hypothetical protein